MRLFSALLFSVIMSAQSPTGTVQLSDARRAAAEDVRRQSEALMSRFEALTFRGKDGHAMPYRLFRPRNTGAGRTHPLVVFLHGSGGVGNDNIKQFTGGNLAGSDTGGLTPVGVGCQSDSNNPRLCWHRRPIRAGAPY